MLPIQPTDLSALAQVTNTQLGTCLLCRS